MIILDDNEIVLPEMSIIIGNYKDAILKELEEANKCSRYESTSYLKPIYNKKKKDINTWIKTQHIKIYHSTRIIDKETILIEGLRKLKLDEMFQYVISFLSDKITNEQLDLLTNNKNKFIENLKVEHKRENYIWFSYLKKTTQDFGCFGFYNFFGGEVIYKIFNENGVGLEDILTQIGIPVVVEACIEIKDLCESQVTSITDYVLDKYIYPDSHIQIVDGYINKNILSNQIIDVYDFKQELFCNKFYN